MANILTEIFPNNKHMKVIMYASTLLGIWPFVFKDYPKLRKLYKLYSAFMLTYYIIFVITEYMELFSLLSKEEKNVDVISANMCVTLLYTIISTRQLMMKRKCIREFLKTMLRTEEEILSKGDQDILKIYNDCAATTSFFTGLYICVLISVALSYFVAPFYVPKIPYVTPDNVTVYERPLPLSSWFPFDYHKHSMLAYWIHVLDGSIGASYVAYTESFAYGLIMFPVGQIRILNHILLNIDKYANELKKERGIEDEELADFEMMKEVIFKHRSIIKLIDEFNEAMGYLMVADFLQCSIQLASIVAQTVGKKFTFMLCAYVFSYLIGMLMRLVLQYYNANEILLGSQALGDSLFLTPWYQKSPRIKYMVHFFLVRTKKELKLFIGPFGVMSLSSLLSIIKATYSYVMLMYSQN